MVFLNYPQLILKENALIILGAISRPPMSRIQDGYRTPRRSSYTGDSSDTETETGTKPRSQRTPKLKSRKSPNTSHDSSHTETESRNDGRFMHSFWKSE